MHKIAVVGDKDSVLAFKVLGIDVYTVSGEKEARITVDRLAEEAGIIFITERTARLIPKTIERYDKKFIPAVLLIPDNQGKLNIGMERINKNMEKAVGVNILE